jgi:ABC-2 type transport system permease protein
VSTAAPPPSPSPPAPPPPAVRPWLGPYTFFLKETRRFLKVPGQTLLSPAVTTALYLLVFGYALGGRLRSVHGVPYFEFIVPGLVMLGLVNNAFLNTSSSMIGMKLQGSIIDILVTPLGQAQILAAMVAAAALRGLMVGAMTWIVAAAARGAVQVAHPGYALAFPLLAAVGFAAVGLLTGQWADRFEQLNVVPAFILTPLTFLGGVFYDIRTLPAALQAASRLNPILYIVEGMRHGLLGFSAVPPGVGLAALLAADALVVTACLMALRSGWKLRS